MYCQLLTRLNIIIYQDTTDVFWITVESSTHQRLTMKQMLKSKLKPIFYKFSYWKTDLKYSREYQLMLMNQYRQLAYKQELPDFQETGCHIYSQTDEDGFLLYIFSLIDFTNKKAVEICAGEGIECNTANLIINHGWKGLLFDGNPTNIKIGKTFYEFLQSKIAIKPKFVNAWIPQRILMY